MAKAKRLYICLDNAGYEVSLERLKIYVALPDTEAERTGHLRIIDESGEDSLVPQPTLRRGRPPSLDPASGPTSRVTEDIEKMSGDEKLRAMEVLWESLSGKEARFESPLWHEEALRETVARHDAGMELPIDWDAAKRELRKRAERKSYCQIYC
jgi:Putative addiction module component